MGFGAQHQHIEKFHAIRTNAAVLGVPIPILFGQNRLTARLIWTGDFTAKKGKQQGGKGLGKGGSQYVYTSSIMAILGMGPMNALLSVWDATGRYVVESVTETYVIVSPFTYVPLMAPAFAVDQGAGVQTAYSHTVNDYGSPGSTTLAGNTNVPMAPVTSGGSSLSLSDNFPGSALSANWTVLEGTFSVGSAAVFMATHGADSRALAYWNANSCPNDQYSQGVAYSGGTSSPLGVAVRIQGSGENYYGFYCTSSTWTLFKVVAGTATTLDSGSHALTTNDILYLQAQGSTLTAKINGTVVSTKTDSSFTSGQPGFASEGTSSSNGLKTWTAGSLIPTLSSGQYFVDGTNTYNFASADAGKTVQITYGFYRYVLATEELSIVPFTGPYNVTVQNSAVFKKDLGVVYDPSGVALVAVSGTPSVGQYHYAGSGTYNFAAADAGQPIIINYEFTDPNAYNNAPQHLNLTLIAGAQGQSPWAYLASKHPTQALGYTQLGMIASSQLYLGYSPTLPNYNFEIAGAYQVGGGILDANPADCIEAILSDPGYGIGFPQANIGSLTLARNCWTAYSFFISPVLENQESAASVIGKWLEAGMVGAYWSEGLLKFVPYSDTSAVGNGAFYQSPVTVVAAFTDSDFLIDAQPEDPVKVSRSPWMDAYNRVQVSYNARVNDYNPEVIYEQDDGSIQRFGLRQEDSQSYEFITTLAAAQYAASMRLQRNVYIRNTYSFRVPSSFAYLEPMDVVTITDSILGLSNTPVRIQSIEDDPEKGLTITAEDYIWGTAQPAYNPKDTNTPGDPLPGQEDPGDTTAVIFEIPSRLGLQAGNIIYGFMNGSNQNWGGCHVWVSFDGVNYQLQETVNSAARVGELTAALAAYGGTNPDTGDTLSVQMNDDTPLSSTTPSGAASNVALCAIVGTLQNNFAPNGDFEQSSSLPPADWTTDAAGTTLSYDTSTPHSGVRSLVVATTHQFGAAVGPAFPGVVGATYYVQGWIKSPSGKIGDIQLEFLDSSMTYVSGVQTTSTGSSWTSVSASGVAPAGTAFVRMSLQVNDVGGGTVEFDDVISFMSSAANPSTPYSGLELVSPQTATLTGENAYDLTTLYRGVYGTNPNAHAIGELFCRLDEASFQFQFDPTYLGKTIYYKFTSFNLLGQNEQSLADVTAYSFVIAGSGPGAIALDTGNLLVQAPGYTAYRPLSNPLTAHDAGSSVTINIASFNMRIAGEASDPSYNSGSVTGLSYNTLYYIYFDDPAPFGGSVTYVTTTNKEQAFQGISRFFIGSIQTPAAGAPDTVGNSDGGNGSQGGMLNTFGFGTYTTNPVNITNPQNMFDGDRTTFAFFSVGSSSGAGFVIGVAAGITRRYSSIAIKVDWELDTNSGSGGTGYGAQLNYGFQGVNGPFGGGSGLDILYATGTTFARKVDSIPIPPGTNIAQVLIGLQALAQNSGTVAGKIYQIWIEAIE